MARYTMLRGECRDILPTLPAEWFDAVVCDPPYGLKFMGKKWDYDVPSVEDWVEVLRVLKPGGHLLSFAGTRTHHRMAINVEDAGFEIRDMIAWVYGSGFPKSHNLEEDWDGWGTALKPALEPIIVARKPLIGTVVENVLKHGTGALNIDGCRVEGVVQGPGTTPPSSVEGQRGSMAGAMDRIEYDGTKGRWPANLIHDGSDEVLEAFPDAPGQMADASTNADARKTQNVYGEMRRGRGDDPSADSGNGGFRVKPGMRRLDSGSAARFFYCSKASKKDRGTGNNHPTVKPTDLMRYLVRPVMPPGGRLLDPFAGSGSTLKAALLEGFDCLGIDRDKDGTYLPIAHSRLDPLSEGPMPIYPDLLPPAHVRVVETGGRIVLADNDDNVYFEVSPDGYDKDNNAVWSSPEAKTKAYRRALALKYVLDGAARVEVAAGPPLKVG